MLGHRRILSKFLIAVVPLLTLVGCGDGDRAPRESGGQVNLPTSVPQTPISRVESCQHRIIFLPQTHPSEAGNERNNPSIASINLVSPSQFAIAQYIDTHNQLPVFSEQASEKDYTVQSIPARNRDIVLRHFRELFPNSISTYEYDSLQDEQRRSLYDNGGEFLEMGLGRISAVYRVVRDDATARAILDPPVEWIRAHPEQPNNYPPAIGALVYEAREREALYVINRFFEENSGHQDVILIFGSNHNFSIYPDLFPSECVIVPDEFQSVWLGASRGIHDQQSAQL